MGGSSSKPIPVDKVFQRETPIQFSSELLDHLSGTLVSPAVPPERQFTLDGHIKQRIQAELERLRAEESEVREQIELALEKENLDREIALAKGTGSDSSIDVSESKEGGVVSGPVLLGDLEEVRRRVDRFHSRKEMEGFPDVKVKQEAVIACYRANPRSTLDCWRQVEEFKQSVAEMEKNFVDSLR